MVKFRLSELPWTSAIVESTTGSGSGLFIRRVLRELEHTRLHKSKQIQEWGQAGIALLARLPDGCQ